MGDVDALDDWEDYENLTRFAEARFGVEGLAEIHPFGEALIRFRERAMLRLKLKIPMYADWPGYLNRLYRSLEMGYEPFDKNGEYHSTHRQGPQVEEAFRWYLDKCRAMKKV